MKIVKRAGWVREGVTSPESVAEHSFRLSIMAFVLAKDFKVDVNKVVKMALIHDLAESITGDLVNERGKRDVGKDKKEKLEKKALAKLFDKIKGGDEFINLWKEYQNSQTSEAKFVKQLDKLEMAIQAQEYESQDPNLNLTEFFESAQHRISDPKLSAILARLLKLRAKRGQIR